MTLEFSVPYSKMGSQGNESSLPPQIAVRTYVAVTHPTVVDIESSPINSKTSSKIMLINNLVRNNPIR